MLEKMNVKLIFLMACVLTALLTATACSAPRAAIPEGQVEAKDTLETVGITIPVDETL